jgi:fused signal recognition particle receptor
MGIFDKVSGLFKSKEDKKEKELSEIEVEKIIQKLEPELEPESEPEPALELSSEPVIELNFKSEKEKLDSGLKKTKESFFGKLARTVAGKSTIDELALDGIEEALITSDIGVETTLKIIEKLEERVEKDKYINTSELNSFLKQEISSLMQDSYDEIPDIDGPYVIMIVGVNGVGKTTTIGKLAHQFKQQGKKVVLGAADTFRAAAVDQLVIWADRVGVEIVKQAMGSDPASVAFDTIQSAKASGADVVIIDTAGRLHNNVNLMRELGKIRSVMGKVIPEAPHDVMLVLDASTGQNAIEQAKQFIAATEVNSISLTKLDGTAKGGVVIGISDQFQIPVRYIGVGEGMNDLQKFNKQEFVDSLFN